MTRRQYVCEGCGATLESRDDLAQEHGDVYSTWKCRYCQTKVPGRVAEKLKHQSGPETPGR